MNNMKTLKEQFVSYEIAKYLKELGYDEYCFAVYDIWQILDYRHGTTDLRNFHNKSLANLACSAPLWQQAIDWLRENECWIQIESMGDLQNFRAAASYKTHQNICDGVRFHKTYEQAREAAILKAIELIKSDKG